jgi:malate synthase
MAVLEKAQNATGFQLNTPPAGVNARDVLPRGFIEFLEPLHRRFTPWQQQLIAKRKAKLEASHRGQKPNHRPASEATRGIWHIELPEWCSDQRNQMTGPADDLELCVKMLNSGAPGVMLDLEDSCVNEFTHQLRGVENILACLRGDASYSDKKRNQQVGIKPGKTAILVRPRGLHISQGGVLNETTSASLYDVAQIVFKVDPAWLKHPLTFYIPKSESADEALWWRDLFRALAEARGWPIDDIKCMALVESHPLAYQMEEFIFNLREHILALNLGRWDYMASLIHFNFEDPEWVLPDRNTIPHDVAFFQRLRELMPEICHRRGILAIGGMTALYPSRENPELNARALAALEKDKKNEATMLMDGAWTGHPDQNQIALAQFPAPNQLRARRGLNDEPNAADGAVDRYLDLRPSPSAIGQRTVAGTRAAVRTVIRYRNGVLNGRGASLLDGYMEDLATDRIYRLMIAQRMRHRDQVAILDDRGREAPHTKELLEQIFEDELEKLQASPDSKLQKYREAREISEAMVLNREFDPF